MKEGSEGKSSCLCRHVRSSSKPTPHRCDLKRGEEEGEDLEGEMLAFFAAARKGDLSALLRFQERHNGEADRGLSVSIVDGYGETALHHASFRGHYQVVEWLMEQDASLLNVPSRQEGETAVHRCCRGKKEEHVRVLQLLLDKGARLDQRDKNGLTPLHRACYENNLHMIRVLLSKGADVRAEDKFVCSLFLPLPLLALLLPLPSPPKHTNRSHTHCIGLVTQMAERTSYNCCLSMELMLPTRMITVRHQWTMPKSFKTKSSQPFMHNIYPVDTTNKTTISSVTDNLTFIALHRRRRRHRRHHHHRPRPRRHHLHRLLPLTLLRRLCLLSPLQARLRYLPPQNLLHCCPPQCPLHCCPPLHCLHCHRPLQFLPHSLLHYHLRPLLHFLRFHRFHRCPHFRHFLFLQLSSLPSFSPPYYHPLSVLFYQFVPLFSSVHSSSLSFLLSSSAFLFLPFPLFLFLLFSLCVLLVQ